jgi:hypothetical protein
VTRILDSDSGRSDFRDAATWEDSATSNPTCLHKKPARMLAPAQPQAQRTARLRMRRELERQVHQGQNRNWPRYACPSQGHPQAKSSTFNQPLALGYFP